MCPFPNWVMVLVYEYIHAVFVIPVYDEIVQAHLIVSQHGPMSSFFFFFFLKRISIYRIALTFYYHIQTLINFWWKRELNFRSLIQLSDTLSTRTHNPLSSFCFFYFWFAECFSPKSFLKSFCVFFVKSFWVQHKIKKKKIN